MRVGVVALAGFVLGGWSVPLGFVLEISPLVTWLAAAGGGLAGCWAFILAGDRIEAWWRRRRGDRAASTSDDDNGRVRRFVDRYGVKGLGLVGPIFPGVTASVAGGLALGLDGRQLGKWMSIGILIMYTLYTVGLMVLIELF